VDPPVGSVSPGNTNKLNEEARHIPTALSAQHFSSILIFKTSISIQKSSKASLIKKTAVQQQETEKKNERGREKKVA
jgi:hypothetical protein